MLGGMAGKIQLNTLYEGLLKMLEELKAKVATLHWKAPIKKESIRNNQS